MDGLTPDLGKLFNAGYLNANPPGQPEFALTAGDSGLAVSIGQAGGEVSVDTFGGVNMFTPATGSFMGIDSLGNVSATSATAGGTVTITGSGNTSITSTNGDIILLADANNTTVALGVDLEISAGGQLLGGGNVNITNAGTIAFDSLGAGAITGVQTINGAVYPPPGGGGGTSITQTGALVACLGNGGVLISSIGGGVTADTMNAGTITFDTLGSGALVNLSTINGDPYFSYAGSVSSISSVGGYVNIFPAGIALQTDGNSFITLNGANALKPNDIEISCGSMNSAIQIGASHTILLDNPGATVASAIALLDDGTVSLSGAAVNISNLSTVNGVEFINGSAPYVLPANIGVSTIVARDYVSTVSLSGISSITSGNSANIDIIGGNVKISDGLTVGLTVDNVTQLVTIGGTGGLSVSTITNISTIAGASDLTMNANTLTLFGATSAYLTDTGGAGLTIESAQPKITGANGLVIDNALSVSSITNVSTINGALFAGTGWTSTLGIGGFTSSIVGTALITPTLVFTPISFPLVGDYTIFQKVSIVKSSGGAGQDLHINAIYGGGATPDINDVYEGVASLPYIDNLSVSTLTTLVANCRVSTIGDTKSIYLYDQSAHTYTANIVAANPVIQFNPSLL